MRKIGKPERNELVVCMITKLHPNSAYARLIEYNMDGIIHVSEVAKRWVRDIREFLKEKQYVVCRVRNVHEGTIELSVKRVDRNDANRKLNAFKREKRAEKMLEMAGKKFKLDIDGIYDEVGYSLIENFGSLMKAFETALKNPELFRSKGVPKKWADAITEIAQKSFSEKIYTIKGNLEAVCYSPDGIKTIKDILENAEKGGLKIRYVSAPKYEIIGKGKNFKKLELSLRETGEAIVKQLEKRNGEGSFELVEN